MSVKKSWAACIVLLAIVGTMLFLFRNDESSNMFYADDDAAETIYIWYTDEALTDYINSAAVEYKELYGVRVVPSYHSGLEYLEEINAASVSGNEAPDLYIIGTDSIERAALAGLSIPVIDSKNILSYMYYPEVAINSVTYSDEKFGYPFYYETAYLLYNLSYLEAIADSTLRDELNLSTSENSISENQADSSEDGTSEGEGEIAAQITSSDEPPEGYTAEEWKAIVDARVQEMIPSSIEDILDFANEYSTPEGVENIFVWDVSDIFYNYFFAGAYMNVGGIYGDDASIINIYNENTVACMQVYQGLNQFFSIDASESSYQDVLATFLDGKTIFTIATSDALATIDMAQFEGTFVWEYSVAPLPGVDSEHQATGLSSTSAVLINGYTTNRAAADSFASFLTHEYIDTFFTRTGKLPVYNGTDDYITDATDLVRNMYKQSVPLPKLLTMSNFWLELETAYTLIWEGNDVGETLMQLQVKMGGPAEMITEQSVSENSVSEPEGEN